MSEYRQRGNLLIRLMHVLRALANWLDIYTVSISATPRPTTHRISGAPYYYKI